MFPCSLFRSKLPKTLCGHYHIAYYTPVCILQTFQLLRTQLLVVFLSQLYSSCTFDN